MKIHQWLKKHGFPEMNLRVLCRNCHVSITKWGKCPHDSERTSPTPEPKGIEVEDSGEPALH